MEAEMEQQEKLDQRLEESAVQIIKLVDSVPKTLLGRRIANQFLPSCMAVGGNYDEAQGPESKGDFIHKLQIAFKELCEFNCWFRLLVAAGQLSPQRSAMLLDESNQLRPMLSKAVARAKGKAK